MLSALKTRVYLERALGVNAEAKPAIYVRMYEASDVMSLNYWLELLLSAAIATLGLVLNSPAVVIGAMLVSPLMGPILSAGMALAAADLYLGIRSALTLVSSIVISIAFSASIVWLLPFQAPTAEILARTQPNLLDLGVAVFSGLAGSILVARGGEGGGVTALPGVAIAVALMPPLCTVGFGTGAGFNRTIMGGAGLLFLTNLVAIVGAAFLVFFALRMDDPALREKIESSIGFHRRSRLYVFLRHTAIGEALPNVGKLQWRVLMIVVVLVALFVPLRAALFQLKDEVTSRESVRGAIRGLIPRSGIVSEQVDLGQKLIQVSLVVTDSVSREQVQSAEQKILAETGKQAKIVVRRVASEEELSSLRERLRAPAVPRVSEVEAVRTEITARMNAALLEIWPSESATLLDYELGFSTTGVTARLRYEAGTPLEKASEEIIRNLLRTRLGAESLQTHFEYVAKSAAGHVGPAARATKASRPGRR